MISDYERAMNALSEQQHGQVACEQALAAGASPSDLQRLKRSGNWIPRTNRVLGRAGSPWTAAAALMLAVLDAGGDASLSHVTAGAWWGLSCPTRPVHLTTTRTSRRRSAGIEVHRVRRLPERWRVVKDGVPVARPELTALQLFAWCGPRREQRAERWVDRMWSLRLLSGPSIGAFLSDMGERGRNGTAGLRRYLDDRGPGYVPPASNLEGRVKGLTDRAGIPLRAQIDSGGLDWTGRVDFRHDWLPVILEVQSAAHHLALVDTEADERRIAQLIADGFHVVEVSDDEVWRHPQVALERIRAAVEAARAGSVPQRWPPDGIRAAQNGLGQGSRVAAWRSSRDGTK